MSPTKEIILIDGSSFLFRAYHAMGRTPLSTSDGRTTQAVFGMVNMLNSLIKECQPEHIAVVMDAKGKTFRHDIYLEYKANRPPMPDDLRSQLEYILKIIPALGIPLISIAGVEADDVIGTLTRKATQQGFHTMIVSSDKDFTQLVNKKVEMIDTMKNIRLDTAGVTEKFGVPPTSIVDYLALMGDSSDNIPGVPKVGSKTAAKWLNEFGSLDSIIANAEKIKGKVGENLRENLQLLDLSKQLATIKCDVDLPYHPEKLLLQPRDTALLREYFLDLEFNSWLSDLDENHSPQQQTLDSQKYETILDDATLAKWIEKITESDIFALDTETTSIDPHQAQLVGLSFAVEPNEAAYLPLAHDYTGAPQQLPFEPTLGKLKPVLEDSNQAKTGQNLKYDLQVLQNHGINLQGIAHDTMLMSYVIDAGRSRHDMDTLAIKHLNKQTIKFSDIAGSGKNQLTFNQVDLEQAGQYAAEDADITLQLYQVLIEKIQQKGIYYVYSKIEIPLISTLARIESNGVKIDSTLLAKQSISITQKLIDLEQRAYRISGETFNIGSPKQIQYILYEKQNLPTLRKTPKGQPSTAEDTLQELAEKYELPQIILEHRGLSKLKSTYTDKLPLQLNGKTQRIHTSYHQAVAVTGRLSSTNPNLQNIPIRTDEGKKIREAFIPEKNNVLIAADYSQIELRIMAHLSQDTGLINAFNHDQDVHSATASEVFDCAIDVVTTDQRRRAKAINFGLIYGMSAFGLARQLKIAQKEAKQYIEIYFDRYPGVKNHIEEIKKMAREQGYVSTLFGRRLNLPDINAKNGLVRKYAERTAINAPMQGSAADIIKMAMLRLDEWLINQNEKSKIIMQVHDELVLETPKDDVEKITKMVPEIMCKVARLAVPLTVDVGVGRNWKEAH